MAKFRFYKYHGAGNDFLIADNRAGDLNIPPEAICRLCDRHLGFGADGVMLLGPSDTSAFRMDFFNPDGTSGMMCGNGGRCIVSFAIDMGVVCADGPVIFDAPDGRHEAEVIRDTDHVASRRTVRLKMKDVRGVHTWLEEKSCFLDTGTRHLVKFVDNLSDYPVESEGRRLRHDPHFAPAGTNVNFVEPGTADGKSIISVRTFEKGVEAETLACGTGVVASAIAAYSQRLAGVSDKSGRVFCHVKTAISTLAVEFVPGNANGVSFFEDVWLTGPADFVGTIEIIL